MKKKIIIVIIGILALIVFLVGLYFYGLTRVSKDSDKVTFNIKSGASTKEVIDNLAEANIIKSKVATYIYVKLHKDILIQAGDYELNRNLSVKEIFNILRNGKTIDNTVKVTFLEGKRVVDYIKVISSTFGYTEDEILQVLNDQEFLKSMISKYPFLGEEILNSDIYYSLEGYLFPSTYEFYKDSDIKDILQKMLAKTGNVLDNYSADISASGKSVHEILTMASIIENETMVAEDRSIVSQVIYKRLAINMSLGMDVTAYYGVRKALSEPLTTSDLNAVNAYNTRNTNFIGLPVGPISNPSEEAIKAALHPSDTNYLYFYADKNGKLHFASNNEEFQKLIRMYS